MFTHAYRRSTEFDYLWNENISARENIRRLFDDYIPYSFNFFSRKHVENITKANEIIHVMQHGIYNPGANRSYILDDNVSAYLYLRTCVGEGNVEDFRVAEVFGEFNRRLQYALQRLEYVGTPRGYAQTMKEIGNETVKELCRPTASRGGIVWRGGLHLVGFGQAHPPVIMANTEKENVSQMLGSSAALKRSLI
jgi:hypothetical protein